MNFRIHTNLYERKPVFDLFKSRPTCYAADTDKPFYDYLLDLREAKYCLSPFGNGRDCHRVYEAIAVGCVPIVKTSCLDQLHSHMPVLIVEDWLAVSDDFLNMKYTHLEEGIGDEFKKSLYADFWIDKINRLRFLI